jgi:hypothetical protein
MVGLVFGGLEILCLVVDGQKMVRLVVMGENFEPGLVVAVVGWQKMVVGLVVRGLESLRPVIQGLDNQGLVVGGEGTETLGLLSGGQQIERVSLVPGGQEMERPVVGVLMRGLESLSPLIWRLYSLGLADGGEEMESPSLLVDGQKVESGMLVTSKKRKKRRRPVSGGLVLTTRNKKKQKEREKNYESVVTRDAVLASDFLKHFVPFHYWDRSFPLGVEISRRKSNQKIYCKEVNFFVGEDKVRC